MLTRIAILILLSLVSCAGSVGMVQRQTPARRPNVIFLFADDQRPDTIAAHGNPHIRTPHLDRLAQEGFSFRNHYCAGSYSGAVCVASRSMLMTGRHWPRIADRRHWSGMPLLPEMLGNNGYRTHAIGKWHNGLNTLARGFQSGSNLYMGGMCDHTKVPIQHMGEDGKLTQAQVGSRFSSTLFADAAIAFLQEAASDTPFFLYVAFTAPHDPRNPPMPYRQMYYTHRPPLPANYLPIHPFNHGHLSGRCRGESLAPWPRTQPIISDQLCEYYGLITQLDAQVGRVMGALRNSPHANNTIVIYTADHGLAMGSHGLLGKQNIYEHSMGAPLLVAGPGVPHGSTDALSYLLDLYPTICSLTGTTCPDEMDGHSLAPIWRGEKSAVRDSLFLAFQDKMRSVRDRRWKLHIYPQINHSLLFDLMADPHETQDLAQKHPDQVKRLMALMKTWQAKVGDTQALSSVTPQPKHMDPTQSIRMLDAWQPPWIVEKYYGEGSFERHGVHK